MKTIMRLFRYIYLLFSLPILLLGCAKEVQDDPKPVVTDVIPFSVSVQTASETRASFDGSEFGAGNYVFAANDKIYITGGNGDISGELTIDSGAGTGNATFGGSLTITNNYQLTNETELSATLVGASQVGTFFTISNNAIVAGPDYPISVAYSSLADLVQRYSHFTASFTYNVRRITLTQQTVFLNFDLELYRSTLDISGESPTVRVDIKSSDGNSLIRSVTDVPVGGNSTISKIEFTAPFPAGTALQSAQMWINNNGGVQCEPNLAPDLDLSANHYYHVLRSTVEEFTVEARSNGATVTFNYTSNGNIQYRTYNGSVWSDWTSYSSSILLSAGNKVSFRGQRDSYTNPNSTPLITVNNPVYIYGDIMSLMCDANWVRQSTAGANSFKQAFKSCTNINIHPDKDLFLSAETLGTSCYESMFEGCTNLTKTPTLPSTTLAQSCYSKMFKGCTSLVTAPELPARTMMTSCYEAMFSGCSSLANAGSVLPTTNSPLITLASDCYKQMFYSSGVTTAPTLPATTLAYGCYEEMFRYCSKLETAPVLPARDAVEHCYYNMLRDCGKLSYVKCLIFIPNYSTTTGSDGNNNKSYREKVFNKWLGSAKNATTCRFIKASDMTFPIWNVDNFGGIPDKWDIRDEGDE